MMIALMMASALAGTLSPGEPAPAVVIRQSSGELLASADLSGVPYIVDFWGTRCGPCKAMVPSLNAAQERLAQEGGMVLGRESTTADPADVGRVSAAWGIRYPTGTAFMPGQADLGGEYAVERLPATFVVGRDGRIVEAFYRFPSQAELMAAVERAASAP